MLTPGAVEHQGDVQHACTHGHGPARVALGSLAALASTIYYPIVFTNTSSSTCTIYGYPGVAFVTSPGGSVIGAPASQSGGTAPALVNLKPGHKAHATLAVLNVLIGTTASTRCR